VNRRKFIKEVLQGQPYERLPRALFGAGLWAYRQASLKIEELDKDPLYFAETLAELFQGLDTDIVFAGSGLNSFPAEAIGGSLAFRGQQAPLLTFPLIQKMEDARDLATVDIADSPHALALIEMIALLRERLPDRFLCATSWGPFTWAMILCDGSFLRDRLVADRTFVRAICELGVRLSCALFGPLIDRHLIDGIAVPDGAVTLVPTDLYREVILPCERKLFAWARGRGIKSFLHQCGNIASQLFLYPDTGADCISIDTGVRLGEVYELYHERVVTAGNVDVINAIFGGDPRLLYKAVSECVAGISDPYRRYILMPSCDLPPDTPLHNVKEFLACADRME